jgi:hypothetical protein
MTTKYTKRALTTPNGLKMLNVYNIFQNTPFQGLQKSTKIGFFGLKIYHLATLERTASSYFMCIRSLQGDRIGRVSVYWAIIYFGQLCSFSKI